MPRHPLLDHQPPSGEAEPWVPPVTTFAADDPLYNPLAPGFRQDPYPALHRLRTLDPVHWSPYAYCWVLTRYDDVRFVLSDKRFGIALDWLEAIEALKPTFAEPFNRIIRTQILAADPPSHGRIRGVLAKFFGGPALEARREELSASVDRFLDGLIPRGRMDVMADLAYPLPFTLLSDMLHIPEAERPPLIPWTHAMMATTDPRPMTRESMDAANASAIGFQGYFLDLLARRRVERVDGPFQALVDAVDGGTISEEEFVSNMILLFCAGHDTVVNLIGNGLLALHRNPRQLELLIREPGLMKSAVEELLRYDTTLQIGRRTALEDVDVGDKRIYRGAYVVCLLSAANRDPAAFPDPDRLDITRHGAKTLSFGGGIHYCLGAGLARLEGEILFSALLRRLPGLRLDTLDPPWSENVFLRGLTSLPAAW